MRSAKLIRYGGALIAGSALIATTAVMVSAWSQPPQQKPVGVPVAAPVEKTADERPAEKGREADDEAIRKTAQDFVRAFNKADATAVAAFWTEQGECEDAGGEVIRGRAAIEKAYADFFKENPGARIEVRIESIRFLAPDAAVESGMLRLDRRRGELPTSTVYSTTHVRVGGQWRVASSKEWGAGVDRLEDLDWMVGTWKAAVGDHETTLAVVRDLEKSALTAQFTRRAQGQVVSSGTMRIAFDPQSGQVRSWYFDGAGGHGQALWARDGGNWIIDSVGALADGTETASVNILRRVSDNEITWRSIDRVAADKQLPDTVPTRLTRVPDAK